MPRATRRASSCSSGDLAGSGVRVAFDVGWAGVGDLFQSAIACVALSRRATVLIGVIPAEPFESMALGADVLVVRAIPFEFGPFPGPIVAA